MVVLENESDFVQPERRQLVFDRSQRLLPPQHRTGIWSENSGEHAEQGGLAASGRSDDIDHLAEVRLKMDVLQGLGPGFALAKPLIESVCLNCTRPSQPRKISNGSMRRTLRTPI